MYPIQTKTKRKQKEIKPNRSKNNDTAQKSNGIEEERKEITDLIPADRGARRNPSASNCRELAQGRGDAEAFANSI